MLYLSRPFQNKIEPLSWYSGSMESNFKIKLKQHFGPAVALGPDVCPLCRPIDHACKSGYIKPVCGLKLWLPVREWSLSVAVASTTVKWVRTVTLPANSISSVCCPAARVSR